MNRILIKVPQGSPFRRFCIQSGLLISVAISYYLSARLGLLFVSPVEKIAAFWPPSGLALSILLISDRRLWFKILITICASNLSANCLSGNSIEVSASFALVNSIEPFFIAYLIGLKKFNEKSLFTIKGMLSLLVITPVVMLATSFMGAAVTYIGFGAPYWQSYAQWFLSDTFGVYVITPMILSIINIHNQEQELFKAKISEAAGLTMLITGISLLAFIFEIKSQWIFRPYLLLPFYFILAMRHRLHIVAINLLISSSIAVWGTVNSMGSIGSTLPDLPSALLALQIFLGFKIFSVLLISAYSYENRLMAEGNRKAIVEREWLLKELHHRVKNNMSIISSILSIQAFKTDDMNTKSALTDSLNRIQSIAMVHEKLYKGDNYHEIDISGYLTSLIKNIQQSYTSAGSVKFDINIEHIMISIKKIVPCGLIVNEIITNSLKYAFSGINEPEIFISLNKSDDDMISLTVTDNGKGLPDQKTSPDSLKGSGLGFMLIEALAKQLKGNLVIDSGNGARVRIVFPADSAEKSQSAP